MELVSWSPDEGKIMRAQNQPFLNWIYWAWTLKTQAAEASIAKNNSEVKTSRRYYVVDALHTNLVGKQKYVDQPGWIMMP